MPQIDWAMLYSQLDIARLNCSAKYLPRLLARTSYDNQHPMVLQQIKVEPMYQTLLNDVTSKVGHPSIYKNYSEDRHGNHAVAICHYLSAVSDAQPGRYY